MFNHMLGFVRMYGTYLSLIEPSFGYIYG